MMVEHRHFPYIRNVHAAASSKKLYSSIYTQNTLFNYRKDFKPNFAIDKYGICLNIVLREQPEL